MLDEVGDEGGFCRAAGVRLHKAETGLPHWGSLTWSATVSELRPSAQPAEAPEHRT
jgi:hypothetical protein